MCICNNSIKGTKIMFECMFLNKYMRHSRKPTHTDTHCYVMLHDTSGTYGIRLSFPPDLTPSLFWT